jgi:hypothetical protein
MQVVSSTDTTEDTLAKLRLDQTAAGFEEQIEFDDLQKLENGGVCIRAHRCDSLESAVHFAKGVAESELRQKRSWFAEDWFKARRQSDEVAEAARGSFHVVA